MGPSTRDVGLRQELFHSDSNPKSCNEMTTPSSSKALQGNSKRMRNRSDISPSREFNGGERDKSQIRDRKTTTFPQYMRV